MSDGLTRKGWSWPSRLKAEQATKTSLWAPGNRMCGLDGQVPLGTGLDALSCWDQDRFQSARVRRN